MPGSAPHTSTPQLPNTRNWSRAKTRRTTSRAARLLAVADRVARYGLTANPGLAFEWASSRRCKSDAISFYRPDEVRALARAAASEQDAAIFIVAAFTGLRLSELRALRWRALDFEDALVHVERGYTDDGGEDLPKSYRVRSVPMMPQVAAVLESLHARENFVAPDDHVFVNSRGGQGRRRRAVPAVRQSRRAREPAAPALP
jgi:integrase